jgi:DNA-directed RNA polymerase subunit omega
MLHPSYSDLMSRVNDRKEVEDQLQSRYSIVIATAKRARQIVDGDEPLVDNDLPRALSLAVIELYEGKIDIV